MINHPHFAQNIIDYAKQHGRYHLPWKQNPTPYRVWISEVMLQQTQVQTVIEYYEKFIQRFPDVETLALSSIDDVLALWAGLGYYRRAHFIHNAAIQIVQLHGGSFPSTVETLMTLPGIGRSTAGAILAQAFNISAPILDGNVKRVLMRQRAIPGYPGSSQNLKKLWALSEKITPLNDVDSYTQGIMDLGANTCTKKDPYCDRCPVQKGCVAFETNCQHLYPEAKPSKKKPTRRCFFSVLLNERSEILFVKRPTKGIWGGLWCLPAMSCPANFKVNESNIYGDLAKFKKMGRQHKHVFTHFNLEYKPVIMSPKKNFVFKNRDMRWLKPKDALGLGLPTPIKKLLEGELSCLK